MSEPASTDQGQANTDTPASGEQKPDTLLGNPSASDAPAADAPPGDGKPAETEAPKDEAQKSVAPEKYELKAPEGFAELDGALVESFEPLAREMNLTNESAQKLVETMMPKVVERLTAHSTAAWETTLAGWVETAKTDAEIGGEALPQNLQSAQRALDRFASPELRALLDYRSDANPNGLGLGNHPELVRVFARIGKAMADDKFVTSNSAAGTGPRDPADVLFGQTHNPRS